MIIDAESLHFSALNEAVRACGEKHISIKNCVGQRYIAAGLTGREIEISGTPGNALGAYLNGGAIRVLGNVQEATGDTMNGGEIDVFGSAGDASGYAMRGGKIFIRGDAGYRCGIHMKAYKENKPAIVIGGRAGSFLGEYQAGGIIVVLGNHKDGKPIIGNFCGTGMHGGEIYLRCEKVPAKLPAQVRAERLEKIPQGTVRALVSRWCSLFGEQESAFTEAVYYRLPPDSENPYRQMYAFH